MEGQHASWPKVCLWCCVVTVVCPVVIYIAHAMMSEDVIYTEPPPSGSGQVGTGHGSSVVFTEHSIEPASVNDNKNAEHVPILDDPEPAPTLGECRLETRTTRMDTFCKQQESEVTRNHHITDEEVQIAMGLRMKVDEVHKIVFCAPLKAGSTSWGSFLHQWAKISDPSNTIYHTILEKKYSEDEVRYMLKNYHKVMAARHPLDRLVSAYNEKILKNDVRRAHAAKINDTIRHGNVAKPMSYYYDTASKTEPNTFNIEFSEFLEYMLINNNAHWTAMTDYCRPCDIHYDAVVKLETASRDAELLEQTISPTDTGNVHVGRKHSTREEEDVSWDEMKLSAHIHKELSRVNQTRPWVIKRLELFMHIEDELLERILQYYINDFQALGYDYDLRQQLALCTEDTKKDRSCC